MTRRTEHQIDTVLTDSIDIQTRTIFLNDGIDEESLGLLLKGFALLGKGPITIKMNSGGGDVTPGLAMIGLIRQHGNVTIEVWGRAESMAAVILQAAKKRLMAPNAHLMLHQGVEEPAADSKKNIKALLRLSDKQDDVMDELVLRRIQKKHKSYSWAKFREETVLDQYFNAEQAKKWNLVDEIIGAKK